MIAYQTLLREKGWILKPCRSCGGRTKNVYIHAERVGETIEISRGLFRYKVGVESVSGGSVQSLQHQHFLQ
jgi:hypothetical protein